MFETPLIERFSRVHPVAPFVFWSPFLIYFLYRGVDAGLPAAAIVAAVVGGALLWSITEYVLHRFVFHRIGPSLGARRFYFVLHGVHHDFPTDRTRLVMPLGVSIPIGVSVYLVLRAAFGAIGAASGWAGALAIVDPAFVGFGIGYLSYDGIHYATHHFRMQSGVARWLKRYHMVHHHTGENARWGVSSPLWDWILGTMGKSAPQQASHVVAAAESRTR
jgi:sterol desaturase/sphingolipid hydroxylase (fatty acid hydroxylase superfamily)